MENYTEQLVKWNLYPFLIHLQSNENYLISIVFMAIYYFVKMAYRLYI